MNLPVDLQTVWFILVAVLFTGYAVLDGFDLGVGILHLLTRQDSDRRVLLNAIGPFWDGNEVWLVVGGGSLFAAFPEAYATLFSGFYLAFMLLLFALIWRAVAIEFRSKQNSTVWRGVWDFVFSVSSLLAALIWGVAAANLVRGVPLGNDHEFHGSFLSLFHPFSLLAGCATVALFALHGAAYLFLKTEEPLREQVKKWLRSISTIFLILVILTLGVAVLAVPNVSLAAKRAPWGVGIFVGLFCLSFWSLCRAAKKDAPGRAFFSSSLLIVSLVAAMACGLFPNLIASYPNPENSLTLYNAASSSKTLRIMLLIALGALPLVLVYTFFVHRVFRGKVKVDPASY